MGDELKPVPHWMEELSQSQMDAAFELLARAEKAEAEVERLARERDEARAAAESWSRETKERQRALEVAIEERASALAERNEARDCEEGERNARRAAEAQAHALREALSGLLREEWMTYEGNLEASGHASVDDLNAARAARPARRRLGASGAGDGGGDEVQRLGDQPKLVTLDDLGRAGK